MATTRSRMRSSGRSARRWGSRGDGYLVTNRDGLLAVGVGDVFCPARGRKFLGFCALSCVEMAGGAACWGCSHVELGAIHGVRLNQAERYLAAFSENVLLAGSSGNRAGDGCTFRDH